jgi:hypothetical protein
MSEPQTQQKFEMNDHRQLVVFIRRKAPAAGGLGGALSAAESMVSKVTGAVEKATNAVESAMASIPGLNMIIKEDKKETNSQDKYTYFEDYSSWDKIKDATEDNLTDMNPDSKIYQFEYEPKDADGRKQDAQTLFATLKSQLSDWKEYTSYIHFIALDDGGNIANECANKFSDETPVQNGKWTVKTIVYVGTSLYKNTHELNKKKLNGIQTFSFGNTYDFTQRALAYFQPTATLIEKIKDANKGTLSLFIGKIKMHMVKGLAVLLKGVHLGNSGSGQSPEQLYNGIKDEVEGLIKDLVGGIKQLIEEGMGMVKPGDLPEFKKMLDGYDQIPSKCVAELKQFIQDFKQLLSDRAKQVQTGSTNLGLSDLSNILNCLCPLFDTLTASMKYFSYTEKGSKELSQQIIDNCGVKQAFAPLGEAVKWLSVDKELADGAIEAALKNEPDMTAVIADQITSLLKDATKKTTTIADMNDDEKAKIAQALFLITTPMLPSKIDFYKKLIHAIPFNLGELLSVVNGNEYLKKITGPLEKIGIQTPERLQQSVTAFDKEFKRITGFVNKNNYPTQPKADSLYLIYNSHNILLSKCWGDISHCIDEQTGFKTYKESQGFQNIYNTDENKYEKKGDAEIKNNVPTQKVKEEAAA